LLEDEIEIIDPGETSTSEQDNEESQTAEPETQEGAAVTEDDSKINKYQTSNSKNQTDSKS